MSGGVVTMMRLARFVLASSLAFAVTGWCAARHEATAAPLKFLSLNIWGDYFGNPVV